MDTGRLASLFLITGMLCLLAPAGQAVDDTAARAELESILRDRPQLAASLEKRPDVQDWILERLKITDPPLVWDSSPPVSGRAAEWDGRDSTMTVLRYGVDTIEEHIEEHLERGHDLRDHFRGLYDTIVIPERKARILEGRD